MGKLSKIAKALDMSKEARMERAREMGFDTDQTYYHGTNVDINSFDPAMAGSSGIPRTGKTKVTYFTDSPEEASQYARKTYNVGEYYKAMDGAGRPLQMGSVDAAVYGDNVVPVHIKAGNPLVIDVKGRVTTNRETVRKALKEAKEKGHDSILLKNTRSFSPDSEATNHLIPLSPSQIRSVNAAFDPTKKDSSNLLAGTAAAMIGAGSLLSGEQAAASDFYQRRVAKKPKWQAMRDRSNAETTDRLGQAAPVEHEALADLANKFAAYNRWVKSKPGLDFILPEAPTELVDKWSYGQPTTLADDAEAALGLL